ncbi:uncharacterized protein BXZ73DRAFT_78886 [Epithele typhae]|uniref:uncharacterized protein n=1 Tax=Epithele typhae TaxID=378194 RepID=UPI0020085E36|nr:uncharacterized protein BXZ73DRAFT_78886 [Epithele typhae]KAH9925907.1 hypothetical protein BXZ73DRAFT_78886 [Epithele typhae]
MRIRMPASGRAAGNPRPRPLRRVPARPLSTGASVRGRAKPSRVREMGDPSSAPPGSGPSTSLPPRRGPTRTGGARSPSSSDLPHNDGPAPPRHVVLGPSPYGPRGADPAPYRSSGGPPPRLLLVSYADTRRRRPNTQSASQSTSATAQAPPTPTTSEDCAPPSPSSDGECTARPGKPWRSRAEPTLGHRHRRKRPPPSLVHRKRRGRRAAEQRARPAPLRARRTHIARVAPRWASRPCAGRTVGPVPSALVRGGRPWEPGHALSSEACGLQRCSPALARPRPNPCDIAAPRFLAMGPLVDGQSAACACTHASTSRPCPLDCPDPRPPPPRPRAAPNPPGARRPPPSSAPLRHLSGRSSFCSSRPARAPGTTTTTDRHRTRLGAPARPRPTHCRSHDAVQATSAPLTAHHTPDAAARPRPARPKSRVAHDPWAATTRARALCAQSPVDAFTCGWGGGGDESMTLGGSGRGCARAAHRINRIASEAKVCRRVVARAPRTENRDVLDRASARSARDPESRRASGEVFGAQARVSGCAFDVAARGGGRVRDWRDAREECVSCGSNTQRPEPTYFAAFRRPTPTLSWFRGARARRLSADTVAPRARHGCTGHTRIPPARAGGGGCWSGARGEWEERRAQRSGVAVGARERKGLGEAEEPGQLHARARALGHAEAGGHGG